MEFTETITIDAPIERVWTLTADVESLPDVTPTVTAVERLDPGPVTVGSRTRLRQPGLPPRVWTVERFDAPHRFVWATRLLGTRMAGEHELRPAGPGRTELTLRVQLDGPTAGLLATFGGRSIARSLAAESAGFAAAAADATV